MLPPNKRETTENVAGIGLKYAIVKDVKPNNTGGGANTVSIWETRVLNSIQTNIPGCSLSNNQLTLPPGEYKINASVPCCFINNHHARLRNMTDNISVFSSSSGFGHMAYGGTTTSLIHGVFSVSNQKTFEIQSYTAVTYANGFGIPVSAGEDEVYTQIEIIKLG